MTEHLLVAAVVPPVPAPPSSIALSTLCRSSGVWSRSGPTVPSVPASEKV